MATVGVKGLTDDDVVGLFCLSRCLLFVANTTLKLDSTEGADASCDSSISCKGRGLIVSTIGAIHLFNLFGHYNRSCLLTYLPIPQHSCNELIRHHRVRLEVRVIP